MILLYSIVVIFAWGTWLAFCQNVPFKSNFIRTFYVSLAFLIMATIIMLFQGQNPFIHSLFWPPFIGGIIWTLGGAAAFTGTKNIGLARACGIWAPLNIICGFLWGIFYFKEFENLSTDTVLFLIFSLIFIIIGIMMIIFSKGTGGNSKEKKTFIIGTVGAAAAGILWGSYYIPLKILDASPWVTSFPFAAGAFSGSLLFVLFKRVSIKLDKPIHYIQTTISGLLWGTGNYAMLLLVSKIGAGRGFTISQLCVVVNALVGIFFFKDPKPKSKAAVITFIGITLALLGGVYLGNI